MKANESMILSPESTVELRIINEPGKEYVVCGRFVSLETESDYDSTFMTVRFAPYTGRAGEWPAPAPEKRFSETRRIRIIVPSLSPEIVSAAAAQAGYGDDASFNVESYAGSYVLTFTEDYSALGGSDD